MVVARPAKATVVRHAHRWLTVARHYVWLHARSPRTLLRLMLEMGPLSVLLAAVFKLSLKWGLFAIAALVIRFIWRTWRDGRRSAEPVERNATARSVEETALITEALRGPLDAADIDRFQCQVLKLIASFVRDH